MSKLICTVGCPGAGKTTWAMKQCRKSSNTMRVNRDDLRRNIHPSDKWPGYKYSKANEKDVTERQEILVIKYLREGKDVIVDDTNFHQENITRFRGIAENCGADFEVKQFFDAHLHQLIERNLSREWSVPEDVIHRMFRKQLEIQNRIITPTGKDLTWVFDIDGTLALMGKGESWGRMPYEWDKVGNDKPNDSVVGFCRELLATGDNIIFMSGRDGCCYDTTAKWLADQGLNGELFLRKAGDSRPDCIIKEELLRKHVLPYWDVHVYVEDRQQMVDHWRALGLECWQVAAGRF